MRRAAEYHNVMSEIERDKKMSDKFHETTKCIICLNKATNHAGHVLKDKEMVLAGWCESHKKNKIPFLANRTGCYGGWVKQYGYRLSKLI